MEEQVFPRIEKAAWELEFFYQDNYDCDFFPLIECIALLATRRASLAASI